VDHRAAPQEAAQATPLDELKEELIRRWGVVSLLDMLTEADWLTDFHTGFRSIATRENITGDELRKRLLLIMFCLGTNIGIRRMVHSGDHKVGDAGPRMRSNSGVTGSRVPGPRPAQVVLVPHPTAASRMLAGIATGHPHGGGGDRPGNRVRRSRSKRWSGDELYLREGRIGAFEHALPLVAQV
jgi:hypothetical protein